MDEEHVRVAPSLKRIMQKRYRHLLFRQNQYDGWQRESLN